MLSFLCRGRSRKNTGGRGPPAVSGSYPVSWWYSDPVLAQAQKSWSLGALASLACPNDSLPVAFLMWTPHTPGLLSTLPPLLALHDYVPGHSVWFSFPFLKKFIYLSINFWLPRIFIAAWTFSNCGEQASHCSGFSCCRAWALELLGFSSCGSWASLSQDKWDLPRLGIEPMSTALAGGFLNHFKAGLLSYMVTLHACVLSRFSRGRLCDPMDCSPPGSSVHEIL